MDARHLESVSPSALPDWTLGHVLTHLARNADGFANMLEGAAAGEVREMYIGGFPARNADIEAGAGRPWNEQVADLRGAIARLERAWAGLHADTWDREGTTAFGPIHVSVIPRRRWREVEVHWLDLGLDYTWHDFPAELVRLDLPARRAAFSGDVPAAVTGVGERAELAWLYARSIGPEAPVPPAWF